MSRSSCPICNMKQKKKKCCLELRGTSENKRIEIRGHPPLNMNSGSSSLFFFYILCQLLNPSHVHNH